MINKEFIEKIADLVIAGSEAKAIHGVPHSAAVLRPVLPPMPTSLNVSTLGAVRDYLKENPDGLDLKAVVVHIEGPDAVAVHSNLFLGPEVRNCYLRAKRSGEPFPFGRFIDVESFNVALQSQFVENPRRADVLKVVGTVKDGAVRTTADDGIIQTVTAKEGISLSKNVEVPNPVTLAPFRTFAEVEQPASPFIFRMKSHPDSPLCGLFEADGGAWRLVAIENIREWLKNALPEAVTILA